MRDGIVQRVPSFNYFLLSVSAMDKNGFRTTVHDGYCDIGRSGKPTLKGTTRKGLCVLKCGPTEIRKASYDHLASLKGWNERLANASKEGISDMAKQNVVHGVNRSNVSCSRAFQACVEGKAHGGPIAKERSS